MPKDVTHPQVSLSVCLSVYLFLSLPPPFLFEISELIRNYVLMDLLLWGHWWLWGSRELSQQVGAWPCGPFIFLSSYSWKACSLGISLNSGCVSWSPTLCWVHWTTLCNMEIIPIPALDSQTLGRPTKTADCWGGKMLCTPSSRLWLKPVFGIWGT